MTVRLHSCEEMKYLLEGHPFFHLFCWLAVFHVHLIIFIYLWQKLGFSAQLVSVLSHYFEVAHFHKTFNQMRCYENFLEPWIPYHRNLWVSPFISVTEMNLRRDDCVVQSVLHILLSKWLSSLQYQGYYLLR
jgi:hypothetical protein